MQPLKMLPSTEHSPFWIEKSISQSNSPFHIVPSRNFSRPWPLSSPAFKLPWKLQKQPFFHVYRPCPSLVPCMNVPSQLSPLGQVSAPQPCGRLLSQLPSYWYGPSTNLPLPVLWLRSTAPRQQLDGEMRKRHSGPLATPSKKKPSKYSLFLVMTLPFPWGRPLLHQPKQQISKWLMRQQSCRRMPCS